MHTLEVKSEKVSPELGQAPHKHLWSPASHSAGQPALSSAASEAQFPQPNPQEPRSSRTQRTRRRAQKVFQSPEPPPAPGVQGPSCCGHFPGNPQSTAGSGRTGNSPSLKDSHRSCSYIRCLTEIRHRFCTARPQPRGARDISSAFAFGSVGTTAPHTATPTCSRYTRTM